MNDFELIVPNQDHVVILLSADLLYLPLKMKV